MQLTARAESWPIDGEFRIARGAKSEAHVIVVEIAENGTIGRGECVPYVHYGETVDSVLQTIRNLGTAHHRLTHSLLDQHLPAGAARNALDCALWDLHAKKAGKPVWNLAGLTAPIAAPTCMTISLGPLNDMAHQAARAADHWNVLKIKLDAENVLERLAAICAAAHSAHLVVDANESWTLDILQDVLDQKFSNIALIEQPLAAKNDNALIGLNPSIPLCADESAHTSKHIESLASRYQAVNIKLDKTGGLTEAIRTIRAAKASGLKIMLGCMVGTSLGMAPAMTLSADADFVDLDGPLLLARDRIPSLAFRDGQVFPPDTALWG